MNPPRRPPMKPVCLSRLSAPLAVACLVLGPGVLAALPAHAQVSSPAGQGFVIPRVEVKGQAIRPVSRAYSSTSFDTAGIRERGISQPQELFRDVPGMNVRNFGLSGVADAFVMRGFSSGGHGGDVGIVIDGIPLNEAMSHADGYADLNVVVPLEIEAMTVYRGPVSPLYGNFNRGGLLVLDTRKGGSYLQGDLSLSSFSTGDAQVALGRSLGEGQSLNVAAQVYTTEGYRPQSSFTRGTLSGRYALKLGASTDLAVSGRLHRGEGDSAAYLTAAQFVSNPRGIDPRVQNDGSNKNFGTLRVDLNQVLTPELKLLSFAYTTRQDFSRFFSRPTQTAPTAAWLQREESYDRQVAGAGINLNGRMSLTGSPLTYVAGIELFRESTDFEFYDGLNNRQRVSPAINDRRSTLNSVSAFGEAVWPLHRLFQPTVGVRIDRFTGNCTRNGPETTTDPCDALNTITHTSPKLGLRADALPGLQLRASWAEGFALPSNFIKYAAQASNLEPNIFRQTELGAAVVPGGALGDLFKADLAVYRITSTQEFRTVAPGVFENSGATLRRGFELSASAMPIDALELSVTYGRAETEITQNANAALVGKQLTGVPDETITATVAWAPSDGFGAFATARHVGSFQVNAANTISYAPYRTLDVGVSWTGKPQWLGARRLKLAARMENALDRVYATTSFVSANNQLFAPGAPRSLKASASVDF
jgi:iron complex outermembrane recepter protein